jgi:hypothetical protein
MLAGSVLLTVLSFRRPAPAASAPATAEPVAFLTPQS